MWMGIYLLSLPIWNLILPAYAFWKFDDFSWGDTRKTAGDTGKKGGHEAEGEFDSSKITMKRWADFEHDRRMKSAVYGSVGSSYPPQPSPADSGSGAFHGKGGFGHAHVRTTSNLSYARDYDARDYDY